MASAGYSTNFFTAYATGYLGWSGGGGIIGFPQLVDAECAIDGKFFRTATRSYHVYATTDFDEMMVRVNLGIYLYDRHPSDAGALATLIRVKLNKPEMATYDPFENPGNAALPPPIGTRCYQWLATVEYGPVNPEENTTTGNPVNQPAQVFLEGQTYQEPADKDNDGEPVVNTAGMPFDPGVMKDKTRPIIRILRNELDFSAVKVQDLADKVNSGPILAASGATLYEPRTLKSSAPRATPKYSQFLDRNYYEVEYLFTYNRDTWDAKPLNQGLLEVDPSDPTKRRQVLEGGQPTQVPVPLDEDGRALPLPIDKDSAYYLEFRISDEVNFADAFGFPPGTFK